MSAMTVTTGGVSGNNTTSNNSNSSTNSTGGSSTVGESIDGFALFHPRNEPVWSNSNPTLLDHPWSEASFSPIHSHQHRPWPSDSVSNDIVGDELPYPRQTSNHHGNDFSTLPSSPPALLNGNHLGHAGRFQFPTDLSSPYCSSSLPPMPSCFSDPLYDSSPTSHLFPTDLDRRSHNLIDSRPNHHHHQQQQQQPDSCSLDNSILSRDSKLSLDQIVGRFLDLQLQPPHQMAPTYPSFQNSFLASAADQQQQQQQQQQQHAMHPPYYYSSSAPSAQTIPSSMVNSRLPPAPPSFANHFYINSPSSAHAPFSLPQQTNGPPPSTTSTMFNERFDRNDGYLPFSTNPSFLSAMRFSPNPGYRTTKSGKQQIGPENSNLFICHLPQDTNDQSLMNLFSQFGMLSFFLIE